MSKKIWFYGALFLITYLVRNNSFFWDTVQLASKQGHFLYETGFQSFILPSEIDSGHPPLFGAYMAAVWSLFGKTLPVSHFAMLPFLFGIVHYLFPIGSKLLGNHHAAWLSLLCFADPVLASQSVLVSPDIVLVCFFLMALWSIWEKKRLYLGVSIMVLSLISMRGMMLCAALFAFAIFVEDGKLSIQNLLRKATPFLPGVLLAFAFLLFHWQKTGWIGHHAGSTWAPSFETVDVKGFAKNMAVLGWRLLDFGRVFVWLIVLVLVIKWYKQGLNAGIKVNRQSMGWQLLVLATIVFLAIVPLQLVYKGLLAHRYLLPFFIVVNISALYFIEKSAEMLKNSWLQKLAKPIITIGLVTGNLWVYPNNISMGWDSTLAHLPWYGLQNQVQGFINENQIPFENVGTAFPNIGPRKFYELNAEKNGFVEKDLETNCYVFYSNIMNDFTDEEIGQLEMQWTPIFTKRTGGVEAVLYKNPSPCEN